MKVTIVEEKPVPPPRKVVVELSMEEAQLLKRIIGRIDGSDMSRFTSGQTGSTDFVFNLWNKFVQAEV